LLVFPIGIILATLIWVIVGVVIGIWLVVGDILDRFAWVCLPETLLCGPQVAQGSSLKWPVPARYEVYLDPADQESALLQRKKIGKRK
jgi:hypothetical protein